MKVAFCLYGLAGGVNDKFGGLPVDFNIGYKHYKKHILDKNKCDVFLHTWSVEHKKGIEKFYKPKKALFENQITFNTPHFVDKLLNKEPKRVNNIFSRWYSTKKSIEMKQQFEKEKGFTYDCVFITRFDVAFFTDLVFKKFDLNKFWAARASNYYTPDGRKIFNRDFHQLTTDRSQLVRKPAGYPHVKGGGIPDYWFFSNSKNMDAFATLYDRLPGYFKETRKEHSFLGRFNNRIYNNHVLSVKHLKKLGLIKKLNFTFDRFDDYELVRRKFYNVAR